MASLINVYCFELIMEVLNDFFLKKTYKAKDNIYNFWENFTSDIVLIY